MMIVGNCLSVSEFCRHHGGRGWSSPVQFVPYGGPQKNKIKVKIAGFRPGRRHPFG
ncbi:hypothetical protein [uncultured Desulfuromonas sp.]|uniref:hypothetical protein n=1 Tax=uncultured Desulfuromonas sp. TaxID=181013 RepID=UPI002AAA93A3|nr:hypothetical protein [uncultured Desulfuromonas sp.]